MDHSKPFHLRDFIQSNQHHGNAIAGMLALESGLMRMGFLVRSAADEPDLVLITSFLAAWTFGIGWYLALAYQKAPDASVKVTVRWLLFGAVVFVFAIGVTLVWFTKISAIRDAVLTMAYTLGSGWFFRLSVKPE